jgi:4a-hydroxytetrahydrobiopterin dehydratase
VTALARRKCIPCRGGVPPLGGRALAAITRDLGGGWKVVRGHHLEKEFVSQDFAQALAFVNEIGALAEKVWHHPDLELAWGRVGVRIFTHKIGGLSGSDFVLAAKIDVLASRRSTKQ